MQKILRVFAVATLVSFTFSSCATSGGYSKEDAGGIIGGVLGGILGYNLIGKGNGRWVGAAIGAIALHLVGKSIGRHMDETDRQRVVGANQRGLSGPAGTPHVEHWTNGDRHITTIVTPGDSPATVGHYCKTYTQETFVTVGARTEKATQTGLACWNEDTKAWDLYQRR